MRKGEKEGKICLPTLAFKLISYSLYGHVELGDLCPAPFLLFNLLVWLSHKRERETPETLWDSPACVETAKGSQGAMVLCHHPL